MPCRNLRVLSSPRCVLGPPQTDFANSSWVARYPGSNSLGHLYVYIVVTSNFPDIVIWQSTEKRLRRDYIFKRFPFGINTFALNILGKFPYFLRIRRSPEISLISSSSARNLK